MTELRPMGTDLFSRLSRIIAERGEDTTPGPIQDDPTPDDPGHPEYHRRQRVIAALGKLNAVTPPRYQEVECTDPQVCRWADKVAADPQSVPSLMLWGGTGSGKTHEAFGAARRIALTGPLRFHFVATTVVDMYAALRPGAADPTERERMIRRIMGARLLLLDDLGAAKDSQWTEEITYRVINHRYNHRNPTIITTNHAPSTLPELAGDRIASRLVGMTVRIRMDGPDRRMT